MSRYTQFRSNSPVHSSAIHSESSRVRVSVHSPGTIHVELTRVRVADSDKSPVRVSVHSPGTIHVELTRVRVVDSDNSPVRVSMHSPGTIQVDHSDNTPVYESRCTRQGQFTSSSPAYESLTSDNSPVRVPGTIPLRTHPYTSQFASNSPA